MEEKELTDAEIVEAFVKSRGLTKPVDPSMAEIMVRQYRESRANAKDPVVQATKRAIELFQKDPTRSVRNKYVVFANAVRIADVDGDTEDQVHEQMEARYSSVKSYHITWVGPDPEPIAYISGGYTSPE